MREQLTADISVKTVGEALGWSKYLTITVAHQLAEDLMTIYDDEEEPLLSVQQDDKMLHMPMSRHVNTDAVMLVYLRESLYWTFIKEVFFETITSYEDFAERFLTTVSTTRNIKRYVVKHLPKPRGRKALMLGPILIKSVVFSSYLFPTVSKTVHVKSAV